MKFIQLIKEFIEWYKEVTESMYVSPATRNYYRVRDDA